MWLLSGTKGHLCFSLFVFWQQLKSWLDFIGRFFFFPPPSPLVFPEGFDLVSGLRLLMFWCSPDKNESISPVSVSPTEKLWLNSQTRLSARSRIDAPVCVLCCVFAGGCARLRSCGATHGYIPRQTLPFQQALQRCFLLCVCVKIERVSLCRRTPSEVQNVLPEVAALKTDPSGVFFFF